MPLDRLVDLDKPLVSNEDKFMVSRWIYIRQRISEEVMDKITKEALLVI
jgi:hypothetical protein